MLWQVVSLTADFPWRKESLQCYAIFGKKLLRTIVFRRVIDSCQEMRPGAKQMECFFLSFLFATAIDSFKKSDTELFSVTFDVNM